MLNFCRLEISSGLPKHLTHIFMSPFTFRLFCEIISWMFFNTSCFYPLHKDRTLISILSGAGSINVLPFISLADQCFLKWLVSFKPTQCHTYILNLLHHQFKFTIVHVHMFADRITHVQEPVTDKNDNYKDRLADLSAEFDLLKTKVSGLPYQFKHSCRT